MRFAFLSYHIQCDKVQIATIYSFIRPQKDLLSSCQIVVTYCISHNDSELTFYSHITYFNLHSVKSQNFSLFFITLFTKCDYCFVTMLYHQTNDTNRHLFDNLTNCSRILVNKVIENKRKFYHLPEFKMSCHTQ